MKFAVSRYLCSELHLISSISQRPLKPRWTSIFICCHISLESRKPSFPTRSRPCCHHSTLSHRIYSAWDHSVPLPSGPAPRKTLGAGHRTDSLRHNHRGGGAGDGHRWWSRAFISCGRTLDNLPPPPTGLFWLELGTWQTSRGGKQGWWVDGSERYGGSNLPTDPRLVGSELQRRKTITLDAITAEDPASRTQPFFIRQKFTDDLVRAAAGLDAAQWENLEFNKT